MVESVEIEGLRGINQGKVEGLTPLTVLVGPNGCGKSTVLDALYIGTSRNPGEAIGRAVTRRTPIPRAAPWLFWRGQSGPATILTTSNGGDESQIQLKCLFPAQEPYEIRVEPIPKANQFSQSSVSFSGNLSYDARNLWLGQSSLEVDLLDTRCERLHRPLHTLYSQTVKGGHRAEVTALANRVLTGLSHLEILTENEEPILHLVYPQYSIPVALAGDGIYTLIQLVLTLAPWVGGLVLLEEPEVHQHPRAIAQSARAIWAAVRRGTQIVISTHSLELIDALLAETQSDEEVAQYSVQRLSLTNGLLSAYRVAGSDLAEMRVTIAEDLR